MTTPTTEELGEPDPLGAFLPPETMPDWKPPLWPDDCPDAGSIIYDASYEEYRSWPAVNASALKLGYHVSPKHMRAAINGELDSDSRARKFGRAIHTRLLEPAAYKESVLIATPCQAILSGGKREGELCGVAGRYRDPKSGEWFCGKHLAEDMTEPADYVSEEEAARIERAVAEVFRHEVVNLIRQHGGCEVSIVWERDGLPCKARLDKLIADANCPDTVLDVKKGQPCKLTDAALRKSIRQYGWDFQAAWYRSGVKAVRPDRDKPLFAWVFLEDGPPFDVRPVWASSRMLEVGRIKVNRAWDVYLACVQHDLWPGYCTDIEELDPDPWEIERYGVGG
jgi:hypothetical protein